MGAARLLPLLLLGAAAVDHSKFRTCSQGSFCQRYRAYIKEVQGTSAQLHFVEPGSLSQRSGHEVQFQISQRQGAGIVEPLELSVGFFRAAAGSGSGGACGVLRISILAPGEPGEKRFRVREGDVAMVPESGLEPDPVTVQSEEAMAVMIAGDCSARLRYDPLELDLLRSGRVLQTLNARHFLNFEQQRSRETGTTGARPFLDATDIAGGSLWEETFDGHLDSKPRGPTAVGIDISFHQASHAVGLAEHATQLHLAEPRFEEPYRLFNLDVFEYEVDVPMALYGNIPMITAVHKGLDGGGASASGILLVNPSEGFVKVDAANNGSDTETWWTFEAGVLDFFAFLGPSPADVLRQYHAVTGWPRMPPLAVLGKHQSRWNYITVEDVLEVAGKFDQHRIPLDFIWLDLEHTNQKRYFTWDPDHFPREGVRRMLDELNRTQRKLVTIIDPHLFAGDADYAVAARMRGQGLLVKRPANSSSPAQDFEGFCWPGPSNYPDFCDPRTRQEWAKLFDFSSYPGWPAEIYTWNDMNEPSVFDGPEISLPRDTLHRCHEDDFSIEHREVHNLYGFYVHEASTQGHLQRAPNQRPFVLTRSFFAGSHRHGPAWTGDNMANWRHLERSVPMLLSLALCGYSLVGADVAGFMGDPDPELFVRWHQLGVWYPFYRAHAHLTTKRREPWLLGGSVLAKVRKAVLTRYRMLPTWYTLAAEWALAGTPMVRPIWYHDLEDAEAFQHADTHFLVGDALLIRAPSEGAKSVKVYLPGTVRWFDFWHPRIHAPGKAFKVSLNKNHLPVFVRAGRCLFQRLRPRRSATAMAKDPHTVVCYADEEGQASGKVYLDDGSSHDYQSGRYIFDQITMTGSSLRNAPAQFLDADAAFRSGAAAALHARAMPEIADSSLRVERLVLVGLQKAPSKISVGGSPLHFQVESMAESELKVVTVKEPLVRLGTSWSIDLHPAD